MTDRPPKLPHVRWSMTLPTCCADVPTGRTVACLLSRRGCPESEPWRARRMRGVVDVLSPSRHRVARWRVGEGARRGAAGEVSAAPQHLLRPRRAQPRAPPTAHTAVGWLSVAPMAAAGSPPPRPAHRRRTASGRRRP
eukprot:1846826-Prymnesium_polylepis.2